MSRELFSMKDVTTQYLWTFQLRLQGGIFVPIWIFVGFQMNDRQNSYNLNNDTFHRPPVISAQGIFGTEKKPDAAILLNYDDVDLSQGYGQFKEAFRTLKKMILCNHICLIRISDPLMMASILKKIQKFLVLEIKKSSMLFNQKQLFDFLEVVPNAVFGHATNFTIKFFSIIKDGHSILI